MDSQIIALKCFIDGLGQRDVEFPPELTPEEITLILEMAICAVQQIDGGGKKGFSVFLERFVERAKEDIGEDEVIQALSNCRLCRKGV